MSSVMVHMCCNVPGSKDRDAEWCKAMTDCVKVVVPSCSPDKVMICCNTDCCMSMGGTPDPCCHVSITCDEPTPTTPKECADRCKEICGAVSKFTKDIIGCVPERCYVMTHFTPKECWGWKETCMTECK